MAGNTPRPDFLATQKSVGVIIGVGAYAPLGGVSSLFGWALDIRRLTDWNNSGISIQPNATICVALSGLALLMLAFQYRRLAAGCGVCVALIGGATVFEWISGVNLGIDSLLMFGREWGRVGVIVPGRMGPPGALSWTLIGTALALSASSLRPPRAVPVLALATLTISALSLTGYLYGASTLYPLPKLTVIAFQTASFIAAISIGLIASAPERQPLRLLLEDSTAGLLSRRLVPLLIFLPLTLGWLRVAAQNAGLFDTAFGSTVRTVVEIIILMGLLLWAMSVIQRHDNAQRESSQRTNAMLGSITDVFFTMNAQWQFAFINDETTARFGRPRQQIIGQNIWEMFPDAVGSAVDAGMRRAMAERVIVEYDMFYVPWQRWFHDKVYPTPDGGLAVYSQDITQRKAIEDQLQQSQKTLNDLIEGAPVGIYIVDSDFRLAQANKGSQDGAFANVRPLFGRDFSEVMRILWPEPTATEIIATFRHTLETGEPYFSKNYSSPRADIEVTESYEWELHRILLPNGQNGVVCYYYDLTKLRNAELALRQNEELLRTATENSRVGLVIISPEHRYLYANTAYADVLGLSTHQIIGQRIADVLPSVYATEIRPRLERAFAGERVTYELSLREQDRHIAVSYQPQVEQGEGRTIKSVIVAVVDVTDRRRHEEALQHAKEAAEAANNAKDNFLATLSHELRTPLTPVLGTLSLWEQSHAKDLPGWMLNDIVTMRRNLELEARLIDDLLDLTRIVKGKISLNLEVLDLHDLIGSVVEICRSDIQAKRLELSQRLEACDCWVRGDAGRLQQALWNLIRNAAKFTPERGHISVSTRNDGHGGMQVIVEDDGVGITTEEMKRLFQPFQQGDEQSIVRYGGLGLGLSITKSLLEAQDGSISAQSPGKGRGATFIITLPCVATPKTPSAAAHASDRSAVGGDPVKSRDADKSDKCFRVLLVEDHADTARILGRLLRGNGHEVQIAESVRIALHALENNRFDILVSDIGLPDGTGLDLIRQIRAQHGHQLPAVALTGFGMEDDISRCIEAGFNDHLTKPVNFVKFQQLLQRVGPKETDLECPAAKPNH